MENRKKHGELMLSQGCITAVATCGSLKKGFVIIGNEFGDIIIYSVANLSFVRLLNGHKKQITAISIHISGNVFVSTSEDSTIRLWDMSTYLCVFFSKLENVPIDVKWSLNGVDYIILTEFEVGSCSSNDRNFL